MKPKASVRGGGHHKDPTVGGQAQERRPHQVRHGEVVARGDQLVEPTPQRGVLRMVATVGGEHNVDDEDEHRSTPPVEGELLVKRLVHGAAGGEVEARPGPGAGGEDWDLPPSAFVLG
jgi:hypothetical protein